MSVLRFGEFELDPSVPELRRRGRRLHLQEMPLRVLEMLLHRPGELVSREAFFTRLWPDDDTGILDDNLNTAVSKLRVALHDSAHHPRFIVTVPKRGYRFVAPVEREDARIAAGRDADRMAPARASAPPRRWPWLAGIAASLAVAAGVFIVIGTGGGGSAGRDAGVRSGFRSVAVLPFVNASPDEGSRYFSDGLTEELMDRLARTVPLRVVSRTSAFALEGAGIGAREIGRLLDADALVEGTVRRDGERLRISVRLVDARDGYQLWSETYDRRIDDVFAVQENIALSIAGRLTGELAGRVQAQAPMGPVAEPLAYDHYLRGRFYWHRRTAKDLRSAVTHFEVAVQRAPDYAPAWAGLADAYAVLGFYDYLPPAEAFPHAMDAARRALEIDPENASAEATLGYAALYYDWDLGAAEARFRQAIALRRDDSKAHQWYGNLLTAAGRFDEAEFELRRAQQLDPLSLIANAALGWARYHAGRYDDALEQYRLTLELDPDFELAYLWSGWALEALGRYDEAAEMLREAVVRSDGSGISWASLARVHALRGERDEAQRLLAELIQSNGYVPSYEIAKAWLALGDSERATQWLERALEQRSHSMVFLRVDPQLADLSDSPEFARLAARVQPMSQSAGR